MSTTDTGTVVQRIFDARPDPMDFRDRLFSPTLVELPPRFGLESYLRYNVPVLNQGSEGACTGFGLATVANYLFHRREVDPDRTPVSPRMLYEMAKRYDEWPGEVYAGSSARGAMKGWHKHGICSETLWPYKAGVEDRQDNMQRMTDATRRPLGAYYRVNHQDLVSMHSALVEVGILYATAVVHEGWYHPNSEYWIEPNDNKLGGHAFVIVAYNEDGFWVQNSWGSSWGRSGLALLTYDDWLANGTDVWVARLGVARRQSTAQSTSANFSAAVKQSQAFATADMRSHIVSVGNDGQLNTSGTYGTKEEDVKGIFEFDFPAETFNWDKKRLLIYAHGGLVSERDAVEQVAKFRTTLLEHQIYPLAFIWKTDYWTTWKNILSDALSRRRPEGLLDGTLDFLRDRVDDALEPLVRSLSGKLQWDEMKENGILATKNQSGAGRIVLNYLAQILADEPDLEIHILSHSAGSIFLAPFVQLMTSVGKIKSGPMARKEGHGLKVKSCTMWAPAMTTALFKQTYLPAVNSGKIERFALYTLTDRAEQDDDCANIYHKSLLYMVSNALEDRHRVPLLQPDGESLLGMEKFVKKDAKINGLFDLPQADWVLAPNTRPEPTMASSSRTHGSFNDDDATLRSTLARILEA